MIYMKKALALFACIAILLSLPITAMAADSSINFDKKGSITILLKDSKEPHNVVSGAAFQLYQIGTAYSENGTLQYKLTKNFADSKISLDDLRADDLVEDLVKYIQNEKVTGIRAVSDSNGCVSFTGLQTGLYLVVQDGDLPNYYSTDSFLVSVPMTNADGTGWIYDVEASPKVGIKPNSTDPTQPDNPGDDSLIQTGQLNWPVPVLAILGLMLVVMGWVFNCRGKKCNEK